jgi:hypothetical protein
MTGIKGSCNRPKTPKRLRSSTKKTFRNDSLEARSAYAAKVQARINRRAKKRGKRK